MILDRLAVDADSFATRTGWVSKPEGLCKGQVCVPAPGVRRDDGLLDVTAVAERLRMPLVRDDEHNLWALGPGVGRALETAAAPELTLPDRHGESFTLSSLRGRKVLLVAWASW
jgi:hypothetical protein